MEATIILPFYIKRSFIEQHKDWIFVYGASNDGKGFFGQTYECQGEPNTYPVPTMFKICNSASDKYFCDNQFDFFARFIDERISNIPRDGRPILPLRKIGQGHSEMNRKAPRLYAYLMEQLKLISYPSIEWDYAGKIYPVYAN